MPGATKYFVYRLINQITYYYFYPTAEVSTNYFEQDYSDTVGNHTLAGHCPYPFGTCNLGELEAYYVTARNTTPVSNPGESPRSNLVFWKWGETPGYANLDLRGDESMDGIAQTGGVNTEALACWQRESDEEMLLAGSAAEMDPGAERTSVASTAMRSQELLAAPMRTLGTPLANPPWTIHNLHTDHLGTVRLITDWIGNAVSTHKYFPFGEPTVAEAPSYNSHKFTGHERDDESQLNYMLARYHSATLARFVSPDPAAAGRSRLVLPARWNAYGYVLNNPLAFNDPDGERENPVTRAKGIDPSPKIGVVGSIRANAQNPKVGDFGLTRNGGKKEHKGIDIVAPKGTPIVAAESGVVKSVSSGPEAGNKVVIDHAGGVSTQYAHLNNVTPGVKAGQSIAEGQAVGTAGTTGNAGNLPGNEEHVHFVVADANGGVKDPVEWLNSPSAEDPATPTTDSGTSSLGLQNEAAGKAATSACPANTTCK